MRKWTNIEVDRLRALLDDDNAYSEAAAALDRTVASIKLMCRGLGIAASAAAVQRVRSESAIRRFADPAVRQRHRAGCKRSWIGADARRKVVSKAVKAARTMERCQAATKDRRSEITSKANATRYARVLGWCPPEYRAERHRLIVSKRMRAADADTEIRRRIEADKRAASEAEAAANGWSMEFQAELERARAGAPIVARVPMRRVGPEYSAHGSSLNF